MSAIAGIVNLDGRPADRAELALAMAKLAHRGPDGSGTWTGGPAALGHQMLWTTPESLTERLPLEGAESGLVLTADVRVDNRDDLISRLGLAPRTETDPVGDAEILLAAYERWGRDCVREVVGDYAFAVWDPRRNELFCARDPLATKHFYYYHSPGKVFAFASEIKALLCLPYVPRERRRKGCRP